MVVENIDARLLAIFQPCHDVGAMSLFFHVDWTHPTMCLAAIYEPHSAIFKDYNKIVK